MKNKWICLCCLPNSASKIFLKMKLLTFLLFVSVASVTANSYSQQTKFSMSLENITVRQVFSEIEKASEFIFIYSEKSVDVGRIVNIKVEDEKVTSILDQLFKGTNNFYEIHDRQIMIFGNVQLFDKSNFFVFCDIVESDLAQCCASVMLKIFFHTC